MILGIKISEKLMTAILPAIINGGVTLLVAVIGTIVQTLIIHSQNKKNQQAAIQAKNQAENAEQLAQKAEKRAENAEQRANAAKERAQLKLEYEAKKAFSDFYADYKSKAEKVFRLNDRFGSNLSKSLLSSTSENPQRISLIWTGFCS
jgi:uncharacterized membrane protein YhiD involved in acid resistance